MEDEPHKHSPLYYIGTLFLGFFPWSLCLVAYAVARRVALYDSIRHLRDRYRSAAPLVKYCCVVALGIFLFFSIPSSKRSVYLLPAYPFVAVLIGALAERGFAHFRAIDVCARAARLLGIVCAALGVAALGLCWLLPETSMLGAFSVTAWRELSVARTLITLLLLAGLYIAGYRWLRASWSPPVELAVSIVAIVIVANVFFVGAAMELLSPKQWLSSAQFQAEMYAASFYLEKPFLRLEEHQAETGVVFVEQKNVDRLRNLGAIAPVTRFTSALVKGGDAVEVIEKRGSAGRNE
jgi:4-amino-4-deoxy-L-arabinose transferase-like glycosyltransferase